jgi:hypothetical protein
VTRAPGPRREPGTFLVARKGPDHYPSWEVVADNATLMDVYMHREFPGFFIRNSINIISSLYHKLFQNNYLFKRPNKGKKGIY